MDDADRADLTREFYKQNELTRIKQGEQIAPETNKNGERICIECDAVINPQRLKAKPDAVRCIGCQEAHEAHRRHYA